MALGFPPQTKVNTNASYLGSAFGSPFNLMIECYEYTNNKEVRAAGGGNILGTFILPIPQNFQTSLNSVLEETKAKEGGLFSLISGTGFDIDQEITRMELDNFFDRVVEDLTQAAGGKDLRRVMDNTDAFFVKNGKRQFQFDFDLITENAEQSYDVLNMFDSLSAFALPEAEVTNIDLFRVKPPAMARVTLGSADSDSDGNTTVYNTNLSTQRWLSNPKLCLIDTVNVMRSADSMFYTSERGPLPNHILGTVVLTEIEPLFRVSGRTDGDGNPSAAVVASRSEALVEKIANHP